jgi:hypothetical protein
MTETIAEHRMRRLAETEADLLVWEQGYLRSQHRLPWLARLVAWWPIWRLRRRIRRMREETVCE